MKNGIVIGICEDKKEDLERLKSICVKYMKNEDISFRILEFYDGKKVLDYCFDSENERIDLLYLDIEMPGMDGIKLKEFLLKQRKIWRIVFASSHLENVYDAYSLKTIGFIPKPVSDDKVVKALTDVLNDLRTQKILVLKDNSNRKRFIDIDDVLYLKADGSYTEIYVNSEQCGKVEMILHTKKMGELEREWSDKCFVRVHKTYMVNLRNILKIEKEIEIRNTTVKIPIGRKYREQVKNRYFEFGKDVITSRI